MSWLSSNLLDLTQTVAVIIGFGAGLFNLRELRREQRIENSIKITEAHRELWRQAIESPALTRLTQTEVDLSVNPVTSAEILFVRFVALHYNTVVEAVTSQRLTIRPGLRKEVGEFFCLPVPRAAWAHVKASQSEAVCEFIEDGIDLVEGVGK